MAKAKYLVVSPPKKYNAKTTSIAVTEVLIERTKVSFCQCAGLYQNPILCRQRRGTGRVIGPCHGFQSECSRIIVDEYIVHLRGVRYIN